MRTITMQDLKRNGAKALPAGQVVYLIVNSKPNSVIVPYDEYEALMEMLEDLEDMQAIEERKHEKSIPIEKVFPKSKYGRRISH